MTALAERAGSLVDQVVAGAGAERLANCIGDEGLELFDRECESELVHVLYRHLDPDPVTHQMGNLRATVCIGGAPGGHWRGLRAMLAAPLAANPRAMRARATDSKSDRTALDAHPRVSAARLPPICSARG